MISERSDWLIMNNSQIIIEIERLVKKYFLDECTGHDWWHSHRVRRMALYIAKTEKVDLFVVEASALLHDVGDYKFHNGDEDIGVEIIKKWLINLGTSQEYINKILNNVTNLSFMKSLKDKESIKRNDFTVEEQVLHDSDRLDAIGAIGIARVFAFGGFFKREIHNPMIPPAANMTFEEYKMNNSTSINHFFEKLLFLKDTMLTKTGQKVAQERHDYMEGYLNRFFDEWAGEK